MKLYTAMLVFGLVAALSYAAPITLDLDPTSRQVLPAGIGQLFSLPSLSSLISPSFTIPGFSTLRNMMSSFFNFLPNLITDF